jgi:hypothetical protein
MLSLSSRRCTRGTQPWDRFLPVGLELGAPTEPAAVRTGGDEVPLYELYVSLFAEYSRSTGGVQA